MSCSTCTQVGLENAEKLVSAWERIDQLETALRMVSSWWTANHELVGVPGTTLRADWWERVHPVIYDALAEQEES